MWCFGAVFTVFGLIVVRVYFEVRNDLIAGVCRPHFELKWMQ